MTRADYKKTFAEHGKEEIRVERRKHGWIVTCVESKKYARSMKKKKYAWSIENTSGL